MGRRYFCDYCNKTFIDDLDGRRKHLNGSLHIKLRNLHYEQFRDPRVILLEESQKTPCRRFLQHGECQFAGNCKYTHYTQDQLWSLKQEVEWEALQKKYMAYEVTNVPSVESWLEKYNSKNNKQEDDTFAAQWSYPEQLECRTDLPPSMKKFKPEDFESDDFDAWGL